MTSTLGSPGAAPTPDELAPAATGRRPVPPVARATPPGWRDPRLWVGVAIVAASVVIGVRVLDGADDTVAVWALRDDAGVGESLTPDDLVAERVRFADDGRLERYVRVDGALPETLRLQRALGAGELLPRAALGAGEVGDTVEVPLAVAPLLVPPAVAAGSVVDVYLADRSATAPSGGVARRDQVAAAPALGAVTVVDAPAVSETFAASGDRQLVLAVPADQVAGFFAALGALGDPVVTIVRHS